MGRAKFVLSNLIFWAIVVVNCVIVENVAVLTKAPNVGFDDASFILLFIMMGILLFTYYFLERKYNKVKIDWVLLTCLIILLVTTLIIIWWLPNKETYVNSNSGYSITVYYSTRERIIASVEIFITCAVIYSTYFLFLKNRFSSKKNHLFAMGMMIFSLVSVGISFITDFNFYRDLFNPDKVALGGISSIWPSKNYYGLILFIGILCCFVLSYNRRRIIYNAIILFLFVAMIFTRCSTTLIISSIAVPLYFLGDIIRSFKFKFKQAIIELFFLIAVILIFVIFFFAGVMSNEDNIFKNVADIFIKAILEKDFQTFTSRKNIWKFTIEFVCKDTITLLFGRGGHFIGHKSFIYYFIMQNSGYHYFETTHNGFLQIFLFHGLVGVILMALLYLYLLYSLIRLLFKKQFAFVFTYSLCILSFTVFSSMESITFLRTNMLGMVITILFFLPPIGAYKHTISYRRKLNEEVKAKYVNVNMMNNHKLTQVVSFVIFSLLFTISGIFICDIVYIDKKLFNFVLNIIIGLGFSFVFVPYLVTLWHKNTNQVKFVLRLIFHSLIFVGISVTGIILPLYNKTFTDMKLYLAPSIMGGYILINFIFYFIYKRGSFKDWLKDTFIGNFNISYITLPLYGVIYASTIALFNHFYSLNYSNLLVLGAFGLVLYYSINFIIPAKAMRELMDYYNNRSFKRYKRLAISTFPI